MKHSISSAVNLHDAAPAAEYSAILPRESSYASLDIEVTNIASGEIVVVE